MQPVWQSRWRQQTSPAAPPHNHPLPQATEANPAQITGHEATPSHRPTSTPSHRSKASTHQKPTIVLTDSGVSTTSSTSSTDTTSSSTPTARAPTPPAPQHPPPPPETTTSPDERRLHVALATLDDIDLFETLQQKCFFQTPTQFIRGRVRQALSYALGNINTASSEQGQSRAWKLWLLLPRMLLQRPPGVRMLSKDDWRTRIEHFQQGQWIYLLARRITRPKPSPPTARPIQASNVKPPEPANWFI